jgi:hypothetical protein
MLLVPLLDSRHDARCRSQKGSHSFNTLPCCSRSVNTWSTTNLLNVTKLQSFVVIFNTVNVSLFELYDRFWFHKLESSPLPPPTLKKLLLMEFYNTISRNNKSILLYTIHSFHTAKIIVADVKYALLSPSIPTLNTSFVRKVLRLSL